MLNGIVFILETTFILELPNTFLCCGHFKLFVVIFFSYVFYNIFCSWDLIYFYFCDKNLIGKLILQIFLPQMFFF